MMRGGKVWIMIRYLIANCPVKLQSCYVVLCEDSSMLPAADGDDANSAKTIVFSWLFWPWAGEQSWLQQKWRITWQPTQTLRIHLSTVSPSHLYLHIYSSSCGYLRTEVTNKEVCVQAAGANRQRGCDECSSGRSYNVSLDNVRTLQLRIESHCSMLTTPCWWHCYDAIMCEGMFTLNPDLVTCNTTLSCNTGPLLSTI